ncbi:PQQ-dependent sugar dehydrogenase [Temperatibacter marinus]|uniref:PQQ-dependent sugar dehydrogenase n=1 Tax=Temperatibacter marinus TaxID=1456591 RepID=A0AA52H835_9PROT|nr:PQQ-dependent sugar dehydrogenase [Temperatibacter marinus]WND01419.1 PQQ-dependent sugar dehydrogenase [Temperatibacter marinus]
MKKLFAVAAIVTAATSLSAHDYAMKGVDLSKAVPEAGMRLAKGFTAQVFADEVGRVRHIVAHESGWIYASLARPQEGKGMIALKDTDGDGKADKKIYFAEGLYGTGLALDGDKLYYGADQRVIRYTLVDGEVKDKGEVIVDGFSLNRQHDAKSLTLDGKGGLYINFGVPSNNCMEKSRTKGSPGQMPCKILESYGGVWKFDADKLNQTQQDGMLYSTGHRNAVALEWNMKADDLYLVNHGRDQLFSFFPDLYSREESAELPSEEFHRVKKGDNLGWPYSYYDHRKGARIKNPEYGGTGKEVVTDAKKPIVGFPGHWAPNDILFPSEKSGLPTGALIAFHGSWNRGSAQRGYRIVFVPLSAKGDVQGQWITFADGFANPSGTGEAVNQVSSSRNAKHRPMGLAEGIDGSLYVTSLMSGGRIWKVSHE